MTSFTESVVEDATLDWFADLGCIVAAGLGRDEGRDEPCPYELVVDDDGK